MKNLFVLPLLAAGLALAVSACAGPGGRYIGTDKCSKDGSAVWFEYPNAQGSFDGVDNKREYCGTR